MVRHHSYGRLAYLAEGNQTVTALPTAEELRDLYGPAVSEDYIKRRLSLLRKRDGRQGNGQHWAEKRSHKKKLTPLLKPGRKVDVAFDPDWDDPEQDRKVAVKRVVVRTSSGCVVQFKRVYVASKPVAPT
jgi:hypothetical protein